MHIGLPDAVRVGEQPSQLRSFPAVATHAALDVDASRLPAAALNLLRAAFLLAAERESLFRALHGYKRREPSWTWRRIAGHDGGWRLDHLFASEELLPTAAICHHAWRENGLSDHSALEVDLQGPFVPARVTTVTPSVVVNLD